MTMRYLKYFIPTKQGIIIGTAVGSATKNLAVGIILILVFSFVPYLKSTKC